MINRTTRIFDRWLRTHPVWGLAACLARVVMDPADEALLKLGKHRLPVTIYNDVDHEGLARNKDPDTVPALAIVADVAHKAPLKANRQGVLEFRGVAFGFTYLERDTPVLAARGRWGYVSQALMDSLLAFNTPALSRAARPDSSEPWRRWADTEVIELTELEEWRLQGGVGKADVIGSLFALCVVHRYGADLSRGVTP